jgi:hypothetical protein
MKKCKFYDFDLFLLNFALNVMKIKTDLFDT